MQLSEKSRHQTATKNQIIYFPDDAANTIYFLKQGKVKISTVSDDGRELILSLLGPGEIFGEMSIAGEGKRKEFAEATEDAVICHLQINELQELLTKNAEFNLEVTKLIGLRLRKIRTRLESLCFKSAPDRIKAFIKELADEHGRDIGDEKEVKLNLTHQDIANLTATSRQTVTTILNDLEKNNIILYDRKRILIRDYSKL